MGERIYWQDGVPLAPITAGDVPDTVDIAIIGAGFTGLSAGIHLARAGHSVVIFEAAQAGAGGSSRCGGMIGPSFHKLGLAGLAAQYGQDRAHDIQAEGLRALSMFTDFVRDEGIDCDLTMCGRFRGMATPADYDATAAEAARLRDAIGLDFHMVQQSEQHREIGSDRYYGGILYPNDGAIQPHKLIQGLVERFIAAGGQVFEGTPVTDLSRAGGAVTLRHPNGTCRAGQVLIATNAYSDAATAQMRNRVIPIRVSAIATAPMDVNVVQSMSPSGRIFGETKRVFLWYRPTPDGTRMIFGGRTTGRTGRTDVCSRQLMAQARDIFPDLPDETPDFIWRGQVAHTLDHAPHLGQIDGLWYAGGYGGSGITRSVFFGRQVARRMLGQPGGETAFDDLPFNPVPMRAFAPLAARIATRWYAFQDRLDAARL